MFSKAFFLRVIKSQDCEVKSYLLQPFEVFLVSMAVDLYANKLLNTHDSLYFFAVLAETGNKKKKRFNEKRLKIQCYMTGIHH